MAIGQTEEQTQAVADLEIPAASPELTPMSPAVAFKNMVAIARAFTGNADAHELLQQSLQVIRARLVRADELESQ